MDNIEKIQIITNGTTNEYNLSDSTARTDIKNLETFVNDLNTAMDNVENEITNLKQSSGGSNGETNSHVNVRLNELSCYKTKLYFELGTSAAANEENGLRWWGFSPTARNLLLLECRVDTTFVSNLSGFYAPSFSDPDTVSYIDSIIDSFGNEVTDLKAGTYLIDVNTSAWKILAYNVKSVLTVNNVEADANGNVNIATMTGATSTNNGKSGLVPTPSAGSQDKFLKADGTWGTPETKALSTYGESIEVSRTCFEITMDMVNVDRSYTNYEDLGNGSSSTPTFYLYLNSNYTFDKNKQYLYLNIVDSAFNLSDSPTSNYSNEASITIYNADSSMLIDDLIVTFGENYNSEYDFVNWIVGYYYYYLNGSWNYTGDTSTVNALKYSSKSEKGYFYIPSKNKAIEKIIENPNILDEILAKINS